MKCMNFVEHIEENKMFMIYESFISLLNTKNIKLVDHHGQYGTEEFKGSC